MARVVKVALVVARKEIFFSMVFLVIISKSNLVTIFFSFFYMTLYDSYNYIIVLIMSCFVSMFFRPCLLQVKGAPCYLIQ